MRSRDDLKPTVGNIALRKEMEGFTSTRRCARIGLIRTKSVEAPKSAGYVSPLYCSLKKDAKVRPEETASAF